MKLHIIAILLSTISYFGLNAQILQLEATSHITPQGWLGEMLELQKCNFTDKLSNIFPFSQGGWGSKPFTRTINGKTLPFWVPYEQTAYYYDGMIRCGYLLKSKALIKKAHETISNTIKSSSPQGVILSEISTGDMRRWPHAVFFRTMMEEYDNTHNKSIIQALTKHYKNDTITYEGRDLCNIETLAWLYSINHDESIKKKCLSMLNSSVSPKETLTQYLDNIASYSPTEIHAVTFHEMLKIPAILYSISKDSKYLDIARKAYAKMDRNNMLPDGVCSGEEGLSGNHGINSHEMCNVVDYIWSTSYMLRATTDIEYADRIEKALFNAGLGGITKSFDAHQYYSAPNQVVCDNHSSNVSVYDDSRLAFRQVHRPQCCTGNLNRLLPIYIQSQWMKDENNTIYKMLYGPGSINMEINGTKFSFREKSTYPFGDTIKIYIDHGNGAINMKLRIPEWAHFAEAYYNNSRLKNVVAGEYVTLSNQQVTQQDSITLIFRKQASFVRWNQEEMTVSYGPLLMALPIKSDTHCDSILTPKIQASKYMGYTMNATSDWSYIIGMKGTESAEFKIVERPLDIKSNPWAMTIPPISISIPAYLTKSWQLIYKHSMGEFYPITPNVPTRGSMIYALNGLKPKAISLIPYGCTNLRISMFPFWEAGIIPAEVLATDNN